MKTKQVNPMPAFTKTKFLCVFGSTKWQGTSIGKLASCNFDSRFPYARNLPFVCDEAEFDKVNHVNCKPYTNHAQVLDDWGWLDNSLLDGFVWEVRWFNEIAEMLYTDTVNSKKCFEIATHDLHDFLQAEIKGVLKGSQLEEWAKANDVPIYNDDMEVI